MKQIQFLFIGLLLLAPTWSSAQKYLGENDNIILFIELPDELEGLDYTLSEKVKNKTIHIASLYGISGDSYRTSFVIFPTFEIYDDYILDGMDRLHIIKVEFGLYIKQKQTGKIFASVNKTISGSGNTKERALRDAISKIPSRDKIYEEFITRGKSKISEYFNLSCNEIIAEGVTLANTGRHIEALARLAEIPAQATTCYPDAQRQIVKIYLEYQNQQCRALLQSARADIAKRNFSTALKALSYVDPLSDCYEESVQIINSVSQYFTEMERREWELRVEKYRDQIRLEELRIEAIVDIAKAYYGRPPEQRTYLYNLLIVK